MIFFKFVLFKIVNNLTTFITRIQLTKKKSELMNIFLVFKLYFCDALVDGNGLKTIGTKVRRND